MDEVLKTVLSWGTPGVMIIALGWAVFYLYKKTDSIRKEQKIDAEKYAEKIVQVQQREKETLDRLASTVEAQERVIDKLTSALATAVQGRERRR